MADARMAKRDVRTGGAQGAPRNSQLHMDPTPLEEHASCTPQPHAQPLADGRAVQAEGGHIESNI